MNKIRYMKKLIICLILLIASSFIVTAQERVNKRPIYRFNSTSGTINSNNIVFWSYGDERWRDERQSPSNEGYSKNLLGICIKTAIISDTTYNILVLTYNDRYYSRLSSGYIYNSHVIKERRYCVLEGDQYDIIKHPEENIIYNFTIEKEKETLSDTKIDTILWDLFRDRAEIFIDSRYPTYISIKKYKNVVRLDFNFDRYNSRFPDWDSELERHYFEIPYSEWKKLSIQNKL